MVHLKQGGIKDLVATLFKYILCYGSSLRRQLQIFREMNLNTSYVMVHRNRSGGRRCGHSYLNTSYVMVHQRPKQ